MLPRARASAMHPTLLGVHDAVRPLGVRRTGDGLRGVMAGHRLFFAPRLARLDEGAQLPPLRLQRPAVQPAVGAEVPASTGPIPQLLVHHLIEHPRFRGGRLFDLRARRPRHPVRHRDLVARVGHQMHEPRLDLRPRPTGATIRPPGLVTAPVRIAARRGPRASRHPTGRVTGRRLPVVPRSLPRESGAVRRSRATLHATVPPCAASSPRTPPRALRVPPTGERTARSSSGSEPNRGTEPTRSPPAIPHRPARRTGAYDPGKDIVCSEADRLRPMLRPPRDRGARRTIPR